MEPLNMSRFFTDEKVPEQLAGKKRVELLKALEGIYNLTPCLESLTSPLHALALQTIDIRLKSSLGNTYSASA